MKKVRYLAFMICIFAFPMLVKADCDNQRIAELNKIAGNVQISYTYEIENNEPSFYLNISNVLGDIYLKDNYGNLYYNDMEKIEYAPKTIITYTIYSNDINCRDIKLLSIYSKKINYNKYYNSEVCKNNVSKFCDLWVDNDELSYIDFLNKVSETKVINNSGTTNKKTNNDYIIYIIISIVILFLFITFIYKLRKGKK